MLSFLRPSLPPLSNTAGDNPILYEDGRAAVEFHPPASGFIMTHTLPPTTAAHGVSLIQPPFHYHKYQSEKFRVHRGSGRFYMGLAKEPFAVLAGPDNALGVKSTAFIPAGRYHRFENNTKDETLVLDISLDPESYEGEVRFFRNFFGYLNDCKRAKTEPSIFQLMVFLHSADTPLALPVPFLETTLGVYLSSALTRVLAYWGRYVLGYRETYDAYFTPKKSL